MTKYFVVAYANDEREVISEHETKEQAEHALLMCQEGDDKHDPCDYVIE